MFSFPTNAAIYFCATPVDLRKSFDALSGLVELVFQRNVIDGHLFVFVNKRRDRIKALWWDRDGCALFYKRLERGTFEVPAVTPDQSHLTLDTTELAMLLGGVSLASAKRRPRFTVKS